MEPADFGEAETDGPDEGWRRGSRAGSADDELTASLDASAPGRSFGVRTDREGEAR